jgi:hypothetical protein
MSTALTVLTKCTSDPSAFDVYWAAGIHTQGVAHVTVAAKLPDKELIAELSATQHLLEVAEVCSADRTGNNLTITVSFGAIRKLASGRSAKEHLAPFAMFLRTRFFDAQLVTSKSEDFIHYPAAHSNPSSITIVRACPSYATLPGGERAGVTFHALEHFRIRFAFERASDAWRELRSCAAHSATRSSKLTSDDVLKYGSSVRAFDCFNGARLIVVDDGVFPMIVTAYWHHRAQVNYLKFAQTAV